MSLLASEPLIVQALQYYAKMDQDDISMCLVPGSGPTIKFAAHTDHPWYSDTNTIYIQEKFANDFENGADILITNYGRKVHALGVAILAAIVCVFNPDDPNAESGFLKNLYGIDDNHPWRRRQANGSLVGEYYYMNDLEYM